MRAMKNDPQIRTSRGASRRLGVAVAALTMSTAVSACGLGTGGGFVPSGELTGPLAGVASFDGARVAVGSKNYTEQLLVGKLAVILFKSAGANVQDFTNIPGSTSTREALLSGDLQMMWEYTGTAWIAYLGNSDPIPDEQKQWQAVKDADAKLGLVWLPAAPMNNTYGFAMTRASADTLGISKLSEIKDIPIPERTFCVDSEFNARNDGFRPMLQTYGIPLGAGVPKDNVSLYDTGAIYVATDQGACTFGEIFTTDGRIAALDLVVLEDDRKFFPAYNLSPVVREEFLAEYPQVADLFAPVAAALTNEVLLDLNGKVDVEGGAPASVAYDWLVAEGFITDDQG